MHHARSFVDPDGHSLHPELKVADLKEPASERPNGDERDMVTVKAKCSQTGETKLIKVPRGTPMSEIFDIYAKERGIDRSEIK